MPGLVDLVFRPWLQRFFVRQPADRGALLIDRGFGLLYDVERDITWLQDANYAKTVGRSPDGQMTWPDARAWVAGLSYRGITGWRLPDARAPDGGGPREGEASAEGEIGHLFLVAGTRKSPPDLKLKNFEPYSIYWYRNEASADEAWAYKMLGMKQGRLAKNPWQMGDMTVPLADKVLAWPVHDGEVRPGLFVRLSQLWITVFARWE
ncbi:MAG: hypothetical protein JNN33_04985 [Rhodospirillaceae bacterium]|nr:hypothetical protein [Rhodospirillaceae bacterium]